MGISATFAFAALVWSGLAFPATAALGPLRSAEVSAINQHDVEHLQILSDQLLLTARNADVMCSSVIATFGNGRTREIFRGYLSRDEATTVGLPGGERMVDRLEFNCTPLERGHASIDVAADTPRYLVPPG